MDIWSTLKGVVAKGAPILANAIVPGSGGLAASILGDVLGVDASDPQGLLQAAQNASPEQWVELKKAQMKHEIDLVSISADLDKAYLADRQNARGRDVELKAAGYSNWRADVLALLSIIGLLALIFTVIFAEIKQGAARDTLLVLSGTLIAIVKDVYQFEFGSSRGSKEKDAKGIPLA
jgi:hypothetical protein